jgi:protease I
MPTRGNPMRIACLLDNGFEDDEFRKPFDAFTAAGHEVVVIGFRSRSEVKGLHGKQTVRTDRAIDDVNSSDFDALFLPGGSSPDHLRADPRMVAFTEAFFTRDRPVLAVCHGPQLLITAGVAEGRTMTAWKTVQVDLKYAGANVVDREVVVDGNLVTSRQPSDLDAFAKESLGLLDRAGVAAH